MTDKIEALRQKAAHARDLELVISDLEGQLKERKQELLSLYHTTLPELMDEAGTDRIGLPPQGNSPGMDFVMKPYFSASIAASWPPEKRDAAFALLKRLKAEDLIKTEVSTKLPKGSLSLAKKIVTAIKKLGPKADLKQSVHSGTLGAWLREIYDGGQALTSEQLATLGASVGRVVRPEERK
jgi:hypothetical protein